MAGNPTITFRLSDDSPLRAWISDRSERCLTPPRGAHIAAELGLLQTLLAVELARQEWTLSELGMLAEIVGQPLIDYAVSTGPANLLQAELYDGTRGDEAAWEGKHGVAPAAVYAKLGDLRPTGVYALQDAISRWWQTRAEHSQAGWASVGVRVQ